MEVIENILLDVLKKEYSIKTEKWDTLVVFISPLGHPARHGTSMCYLRIRDNDVTIHNMRGRWLKRGVRRDLYKNLYKRPMPDEFKASEFSDSLFTIKYEMCDPSFDPEVLIENILFLIKCVKDGGAAIGRPTPGIL